MTARRGALATPRLLVLALAVFVAFAACTDEDEPSSGNGAPTTTATATGTASPPSTSALATPAPGEGPRTGGDIGRPATAAQVAARDDDVVPGGPAPEGSGTVRQGAEVYATQCARCHGPTATEGGIGPRLVSEPGPWQPGMPITIGSYWPYAETVFDYVRRAMPFDAPGTLEDDQVYAVVAWLLVR